MKPFAQAITAFTLLALAGAALATTPVAPTGRRSSLQSSQRISAPRGVSILKASYHTWFNGDYNPITDEGQIRVKGDPTATSRFVLKMMQRHPQATITAAPVKRLFGRFWTRKDQVDVTFKASEGSGDSIMKSAYQVAARK